MKQCRDCKHQVSEEACSCPGCGAPFPARDKWDGWGFEFKSQAKLFGWPLLHISFKYKPNRLPVPAKGVIAIGQVAVGAVTISQFGVGIISISQFAIGVYVLAQFALAYSLIAQFGVFLHAGQGQFVKNLMQLVDRL